MEIHGNVQAALQQLQLQGHNNNTGAHAVVKNAVETYSGGSGIVGAFTNLLSRIWNAIKHIVGCSSYDNALAALKERSQAAKQPNIGNAEAIAAHAQSSAITAEIGNKAKEYLDAAIAANCSANHDAAAMRAGLITADNCDCLALPPPAVNPPPEASTAPARGWWFFGGNAPQNPPPAIPIATPLGDDPIEVNP